MGGMSGGERRGPERLAVYRHARAHTRAMRQLLEKADTVGHADLVNQIRRCCNSVTANIREAYEESSPGRKAQLYRISRDSASEAAGHTDNLVDWGLIEERETDEVRGYQEQFIALLVTMARTQEQRASQKSPWP